MPTGSLNAQFKSFFKNGHERSLKIKKNIVYSFLIKGLSVLVSFMLLPLTLHYINVAEYGIWIVISSLVAWINTLDIGLSNGLRNKLAHSLALNEKEHIVKYTSTTYVLLFLIASLLFILFLVISSFLNWNAVLNIQHTVNYNIQPVFLITLGSFCIQFVLQPINSILIATHQPFKVSLILFAGQLLTFIIIYILQLYTTGNLLLVVIAAAGSPLLVLLLASIYLFGRSLKSFAPRPGFTDFKIAKGLLSTGSVFFLIQIGALVLYETDNIIIARTLSAGEVTTFNIAFKYFSLVTVVFSIIIVPFWSAVTDAFAKADFNWIRSSIKKMQVMWLLLSISSMLLYFLSGFVYKVWIGNKISIPRLLSFSMAISVVVQNWQVLYAYVLNGIGKLRIQLILLITTSFINIPLSVFLIHKFGLAGTVMANIIVFMLMNVFLTYQVRLILRQKAGGVWDR